MKRKNTVSKCWAVVDQKYGIVALYWSKKEADEACELGEVLISGYAGSVEEVEINGTPPVKITCQS